MDEGLWYGDVPDWQVEPMSAISRRDLDDANWRWHERRSRRRCASTPATSTDQGYPLPIKRNRRKIGFRKD